MYLFIVKHFYSKRFEENTGKKVHTGINEPLIDSESKEEQIEEPKKVSGPTKLSLH